MKAEVSRRALEVAHLHKSYLSAKGERYEVLHDVSLALDAGEFVSLLGPSGGGKSTLLNILAGLEGADCGAVHVAGAGPRTRPPIAYMQQRDLLLPWRTLWDNILLGPELRSAGERARKSEAAAQLVSSFQLEGFSDAYPAELSGGMRQRAALIRTLLCDQNILLLDEPFGALDAITRGVLHGHLLRIWRELGKTVLLVTHDVDEALALSTRVVLLSGRPGRILRDIPVALPHPARSASPETLRLKALILRSLDPQTQRQEA
ncbi:MAG: ABC transporter ATP-binding protein [bacterium]